MTEGKRRNPWAWVPSLYFAEGLPYIAIMTISLVMYQRLGLSDKEIAIYTSWFGLPWVIKPLFSPFVDLIKTKRAWILAMQFLLGVGFAGIAFTIPTPYYLQLTFAFFFILAFSSAMHDIAIDGFYMLGLDLKQQSFFVGIRSTFYKLSNIFGQGILVMIAGALEKGYLFPSLAGNIPIAWSICFFILAGILIGLTLYHKYILPYPASDRQQQKVSASNLLEGFWVTFRTFFQKKQIGLILFFLLTYRLGESQLAKISIPFLLNPVEKGGLELSTASVGMIYGTIGVIALLVGGVLGGVVLSKHGLKRWIIPMVLATNLPDLLYVYMAEATPDNLWLIASFVAVEQFGYGFGFTAYTLYLIYVADGNYKTAHYAIGTGVMALAAMLSGMLAGYMKEVMEYTSFFLWVCICTLPGIIASVMVRNKLE
ncbi:MAG: MFS transporter [Bacteroides sp.]|nr:MFS transporter [Bacteroides sp.]